MLEETRFVSGDIEGTLSSDGFLLLHCARTKKTIDLSPQESLDLLSVIRKYEGDLVDASLGSDLPDLDEDEDPDPLDLIELLLDEDLLDLDEDFDFDPDEDDMYLGGSGA